MRKTILIAKEEMSVMKELLKRKEKVSTVLSSPTKIKFVNGHFLNKKKKKENTLKNPRTQ